MFRAFPGPQVADLSDGMTRTLTGDGTEFLIASGLKKLEAVWVGPLRLDPELAFRVQHPHEAESKVTIRIPTYDLSLAPDGTPVLRRNMCSNNGVWQKDCPIHVKGIWEFDPNERGASNVHGNPPPVDPDPAGLSIPVAVAAPPAAPPASTIAGFPMGSMTAAEAAELLAAIRAAGFLPEQYAPSEQYAPAEGPQPDSVATLNPNSVLEGFGAEPTQDANAGAGTNAEGTVEGTTDAASGSATPAAASAKSSRSR